MFGFGRMEKVCCLSGFTLAEVLITLGIIGVVAAVTMPTLVANHREKATVAKLKKSYSVLNQAYLRAINEHGNIEDWGFGGDSTAAVEDPESGEKKYGELTVRNSQLLLDIMTEHMTGVKKCYQPACDISYYNPKSLSGIERTKGVSLNIVDLPDGSSLLGGWISLTDCKAVRECGDFAIDINGTKNPPNIVGIDVFYFQVKPTTIAPYGYPGEALEFPTYYCDIKSTTSQINGYACSSWVIQNENMDYLHCDDLSWGGKHKCK